jgi:hypothetical protein
MVSRIRRREEMLSVSAWQERWSGLSYSCCTIVKPGIDTRLNPQADGLHFFGGVFQNVEESVLEAEETDLKDQLLFNDETVVTERIGVYGSARLLNERKLRSDIVESAMIELPQSDSGHYISFWAARKEPGGRMLNWKQAVTSNAVALAVGNNSILLEQPGSILQRPHTPTQMSADALHPEH